MSPGQQGDSINGHGAIMVVSATGDLDYSLYDHDVNFHSGSFSPDGKWLAYIKAEAGLFIFGGKYQMMTTKHQTPPFG